jgi:hypothetical protein
VAVFAPEGRRCAVSASPGVLHGLRQDPCVVARGVAVASCRCGVGDWFGVARQGRRAGASVDRGSSGTAGVNGAGGWLRRFGVRAEQVRVLFTVLLFRLDPQAGPLLPRESVCADALEPLGRAGAAGVRRLRPCPPWEFASWASAGLLLAPAGGLVSRTS